MSSRRVARLLAGAVVAVLSCTPVLASEPPRPWLRSGDEPDVLAVTDSPDVIGPLSPDARAQLFPHDIPAGEISLGALVGSAPAHDTWAWAAGQPDGRLVLLTADAFTIKAARSSDGGASFGPEVVVAGKPGEPPAIAQLPRPYGAVATLAPDGRVYLAYLSGDPLGDYALRVARSDDMGLNWTTPVDVVHGGDSHHGVSEIGGISANASGIVAVVFRERWELKDSYAVVSSDRGASWTDPVAVDRDPAAEGTSSTEAAVAVDPSGRVHVVFRHRRPGVGYRTWYARSLDGGVTFSPERVLDQVFSSSADCPAAAVAADGSLLVAFWDSYQEDRVYVVRSADGGDTFLPALEAPLDGSSQAACPRIVARAGTPTVIVSAVALGGLLQTWRSVDNGASFGAAVTVATTAYRPLVTSAGPEVGLVRTQAGRWLIAWEDKRFAGVDDTLTDVYGRVSADDGATWGTEQRVDRYPPSATESRLADAVTTTGSDNLFVGWLDRRDGSGTEWNVYANRSPAVPLDFSRNERRVDQDAASDGLLTGPYWFNDAAVTADGADHVYVALQQVAGGLWPDIYVAASPDRGRTFPLLRRVSTSDGTEQCVNPQLGAHADGKVFAVWMVRRAGETRLLFNRSTDFGATWEASEKVIASAATWDTAEYGAYELVTLPGGSVYVAWSDGESVFLTRSLDAGATFTTDEIDQTSGLASHAPALCAAGDMVAVAFAGWPDGGFEDVPFAVVSPDRGVGWGARSQLGSGNVVYNPPDLACDGAGGAVALWTYGSELWSSRFDGLIWTPAVPLPSSPTGDLLWLQTRFVTPSIVLCAYTNILSPSLYASYTTWVSRSTDGGYSFGMPQQVDGAAPQPLAASLYPDLAADGSGNVWVSWIDASAGKYSLAVRLSQDDGASFGATYRVSSTQPQGSRDEFGQLYQQSAALPGAAFFVYEGRRTGMLYDILLNAWDMLDFDRDGAESAPDCDDEDPRTWSAPVEAAGVGVTEGASGTSLTWDSQAASAGPSTVYDLVSGWLSELLAARTFDGAYCLRNDHPAPPYTDTHPAPAPRDGYYYLVRAANPCGTATFGDATVVPDPRDLLDSGAGPCP